MKFDRFKNVNTLICIKTHSKFSMHGKLEYLAGRKYKCALSTVNDVINIFNDNGHCSIATYNENSINYFREHFITIAEYRKSIIEELL